MGYLIVIDSATKFAIAGMFTGRDPMTGRYMNGTEFGDDEPGEHFFGESYDPTDDIINRLDNEHGDEQEEAELWFISTPPTNSRFDELWALKFRARCPQMWDGAVNNDWCDSGFWWKDDVASDDWVEQKFRRQFPELWEEGYDDEFGGGEADLHWFEMNHDYGDEVLMPAHSGGRQFRTWASWLDWEHRDDHGRHSCDQGKKGRKSRLNRTLRELRARAQNRDEFDTWVPNDHKVEVYVDSGWSSWWNDLHRNEADIIINDDCRRPWQSDYLRIAHTQLSRALLSEWADDYGDLETDAQQARREAEEDAEYYWSIGYDPEASRWEALKGAYYNEAFLRKPLYVTGDDYGKFIHRHAGNYDAGWGNEAPTVPYADRGWEFLNDPFLRRILLVCPSSLLYNMEELYEAAGYENMVPTAEEMEEIEAHQALEREQQDDSVESLTFAQTGGQHGTRATLAIKTERLRVHDHAA